MNRRALIVAASLSTLLASCTDRPSAVDPSIDIPTDVLQPVLSVLDGTFEGGNPHFFWISPLGGKSTKKSSKFSGVADVDQFPTVVVCLRDENAPDGCVSGQDPVATFTRGSEKSGKAKSGKAKSGKGSGGISVSKKGEYSVDWDFENEAASSKGRDKGKDKGKKNGGGGGDPSGPESNTPYRIKVLIQDTELGHTDVILLSKKEVKKYNGDLLAITEDGSIEIAFRIEEGALCSDGALGCTTGTEVPGDGQPTVIGVPTQTVGGDQAVAAVVTVNDGVFKDANGNPIPDVTVSVGVRVGPPSTDILTDDSQELPFFVEIKTFPSDVFIDPNGPGVEVVICQDEEEMDNRGIVETLHPELILYKVHEGATKRLASTFGAPECEGFSPAPAPGVMGMLKRGAAEVLGLFGPTPLVARRRLHGGLNTVVKRDVSEAAAFSTFGSALGPNAGQTEVVLPATGEAGTPVPITIQVKNALGENFLLAGDTLEITVSGANTVAAFTATDNGAGLYSGSYTPAASGVDQIAIVLIRNDGVGLGPIDGSPHSLIISGAGPSPVVNTDDAGPGSLRQAIIDANANSGRDSITFAIPGAGEHVITLASPLPTITEAVVIDGKSQGWDGSPFVRVAGAGVTGYGFDVQANDVTIRALSITGFSADGIFVLQGSTNAIVEDNHIGTNRTGAAGMGNQDDGIRYRGSNGFIRRNLISGNAKNGILMELSAASSNVIEDNVIGLDLAGTAALPNGWSGITMYDGTPNNVIQNNTISGNDQHGIDIQQSGNLTFVSGTQIRGNTIGLDVNGNLLNRGGGDVIDVGSVNWGPYNRGNLGNGIRVTNTTGTLIGVAGDGNVVSGNTQHGIEVLESATGVTIQGNYVGTNAAGAANRGNGTFGGDGIRVSSSGTSGVVIGGAGPGEGNTISGNLSDGIGLLSGSNFLVQGNKVGTDPNGLSAVGNGTVLTGPDVQGCCHSGIFVDNANNVVIGGNTPGTANVVSGNRTGLWIGSAPGIQILGNRIGTNASGSGYLPNNGDGGIALYGTVGALVSGNTISGNTALAGIFITAGTGGAQIQNNTFQGNANAAVGLHSSAGVGNTIRNNSMSDNGFGIDLGWNGVTANDPGDADAGPNSLQNFPTVTSAANGIVSGQTQVQLSVDAASSTVYKLELFASAACSTTGYGEGAQSVYLGTLSATDGSGQLSGTVNFPTVGTGQVITGTLTDPGGSTSEFSGCATVVTSAPAPTVSSVAPSGSAGVGQGLTFFGTNMNNTVWTFNGTPGTFTGYTFLSPSTSTTQYVYPTGVPSGSYSVTVTDTGTGLTSAPVALTIGSQFGTPTMVGVFSGAGDAFPAINVTSGSSVFIQGYGIYTTGTEACFTQGPPAVAGPTCAGTLVTSAGAYSGTANGLRAEFVAPALAPGLVSVQIRAGNSDFTDPVLLIVP